MKCLSALVILMFAAPAFASHPHDRVCVGQAQFASGESRAFVLQWEITRTYQKGDPNQDPHEVGFELSSCSDDYDTDQCMKAASAPAVYAPSQLKIVPVQFKTAAGQVYIDGTFTQATETLEGKIANDQGKLEPAQFKLNCVSQPRLTLDQAPSN